MVRFHQLEDAIHYKMHHFKKVPLRKKTIQHATDIQICPDFRDVKMEKKCTCANGWYSWGQLKVKCPWVPVMPLEQSAQNLSRNMDVGATSTWQLKPGEYGLWLWASC